MLVEDVVEKRRAIEAIGDRDPERSHWMEDELHQDVLRSIVADPSNARELAQAALTTLDLDFPRWYA